MLYEALTATVLALSQVAVSSATANPQHRLIFPRSSGAETSAVGSNEILREFDTDRWPVRDAIAGRSAKDATFDGEASVSNAFYIGVGAGAGIPGAVSPPRTAASVEWRELLRPVRDDKTASRSKPPVGRSTKGSVELLESLKKARKEKGGGK
jgi:hypothetical protein